MPGGDGTGPEGLGPRTGRGLGSCDTRIPVNPAGRLGRPRNRRMLRRFRGPGGFFRRGFGGRFRNS